MSETAVVLTLKQGRTTTKIEGARVTFSAHQCFRFDGGNEEIECLRALGNHLTKLPGLALLGSKHFIDYLFTHVPELKAHAVSVVASEQAHKPLGLDVKALGVGGLPASVETVFLAETLTVPRWQMRRALPPHLKIVEPAILAEIAPEIVPLRAWTPLPRNIYPIEIPDINFKQGLDLILIDCPSRNLALMPNGLGYLNNALKKSSVAYQVFDLDIIAYHRFHMYRLFDAGGRVILPSGKVLPEDPWQAEHYDVWSGSSETSSVRGGNNEVIEFFRPLIEDAVNALVEARPKILGLSIQQCNEAISREIVRGVRAKLQDTVVLVGGFSCYNADIGLRAFAECDYMCIGEADLTAGPLVETLARGERPRNQAGVLSRYDTPDYKFVPAPMVHNLDQIEPPKYEWCDLGVYRNYNDYQLTPIIASRGCRWSRCTFCAERFYWRIRSAKNFVDELEWLVNQGCYLFMFNESDLNGMPEKVLEICDEIIRRGLHRKVKLTGQLRIHKKSNRAYFDKLRAANFVALRFGVDAFSENTLRLQKKGYTVDMVSQNLRDCWEAGIYTEVNWVIGVPGETDADVEEGIELILKNQKYIGRLANINPLILVNGGVYWIDPKAHNIAFREPQEELYRKFPRALPADSWYSTNPYIDAQVRKERFERIVVALHDAGFPVGAWATRIIEDVKLARDPHRAGAAKKAPEAKECKASEAVTPGDNIGDNVIDDRRVVPIKVAGTTRSDDGMASGKPAAEPPLYGVAGKTPRLVRELETHRVVFLNGWYYGVPHALGEVDLHDPDPSKLAGVIKQATEEDVIRIIEEASHWANTRGRYDAQEKQRAAGSYLRAASALGESKIEKVPEKPNIIRYKGEYIAIDRQAMRATQGAAQGASAPAEGRSMLRRLASKLPPAFQQEIRRIIRAQAQSGKDTSAGPLSTRPDGQLIRMLWRGARDLYAKKPLRRLLTGEPAVHATHAFEEVIIDGKAVAIVSAVTKNALPELMWVVGNYNLVKHDGMFYGLPHGIPIDWETGDVASIPGVFVGATVKDVVARIERASEHTGHATSEPRRDSSQATGPAGETFSAPRLLGSVEGHNIVSYEGWIYGIAQTVGPIDLTEVDVMEMPGVIRDVSRDVVENEILDRVKAKQAAIQQAA